MVAATQTSRAVYTAINAVQADLAKEGIGKDRQNQQQRYSFRGIDDIYNSLAPLLARHKLCILPRIKSRDVVERESKGGGALFYTTVVAEFDFVSAEDGSTHTVCTVGEAMDSGDKSSNKAMSAAYKYACLQAFCIPTEGDNDADETTHEVTKRQLANGNGAKPATNGKVDPHANESPEVRANNAEIAIGAARDHATVEKIRTNIVKLAADGIFTPKVHDRLMSLAATQDRLLDKQAEMMANQPG